MTTALEERTQSLGLALWSRMSAYRPSPTEALTDRLMVQLAAMPHFRPRLLRFVDAVAGLPADPGGSQTKRLLREYLGHRFPDVPVPLAPFVRLATASYWPAPFVGAAAQTAIVTMASRFIAGGGPAGADQALRYLRSRGRLPSFDILGEAVTSEGEAEHYHDAYLALLSALGRSPDAGRRTASGDLALQVSLKLSSLTADFNPVDPTGTLRRVRPRLVAIAERARQMGVGLTLDMERYETRDLTVEVFADVFGSGDLARWEGAGIVLQAYLRDADRLAAKLLDFGRERGTQFQIRLVKGAYWDYETVVAQESGWPCPVWLAQSDTDLTFEQVSERLISAFPVITVAIASHNLRSHAHAEAARELHELPAGAIEHQTLFRTAEGISRALAGMGWPSRDYVPLGELLPGMAYLVRRILENSSQTGFLLHSRSGDSAEYLLRPPARFSDDDAVVASDGTDEFHNEPPPRLFLEEQRTLFGAALEAAKSEFGRDYPIRIGGAEIRGAEAADALDPSNPAGVVLGRVFNAGEDEAGRAIRAAVRAGRGWRAVSVDERAAILQNAASLLQAHRYAVAAWEVCEAAKSWIEALADVDEAIDYLRFYAREARALADAWEGYVPRGVVAAIPPWNFPAAIPCGMVAAALVTGNAVILKPAEQTPLVAWQLVQVLHEAGVPTDALIWLPGRGEIAGAYLVASPLVDMVVFTGSAEVGRSIYRAGSRTRLRRRAVRTTLAEMGGKNPILVFADADLDEAVAGILSSAFGHSGQKCSAASRVLIHRSIYSRLRSRLVEGARSLVSGTAEAPGSFLTPLIDVDARHRVASAIEQARSEGRMLLAPPAMPPLAVDSHPAVVEIPPGRHGTSATTQQEIFWAGPYADAVPG